MKFPNAARGSLIAFACAACGAFAQQPTVTDVTYAPAEDRDSVGAVQFENADVIAKRRAFGTRNTPAEVQAIGRGVMQATLAAAEAQGEGPNTRAMGAPPARHKQRAPRGVKPELMSD